MKALNIIQFFCIITIMVSCNNEGNEAKYRISGIEKIQYYDYIDMKGKKVNDTITSKATLDWDTNGNLIHSQSLWSENTLLGFFPFFNCFETNFTYFHGGCNYKTKDMGGLSEAEGTISTDASGKMMSYTSTYNTNFTNGKTNIFYDDAGFMTKITQSGDSLAIFRVENQKIVSLEIPNKNFPAQNRRTIYSYTDQTAKINPINSGISFLGKTSPFLVSKIDYFIGGKPDATIEFDYEINGNGFVTCVNSRCYSVSNKTHLYTAVTKYTYIIPN